MIETQLREIEVNGIKTYKTFTNLSNLHLDPQNPRDISDEKMNDLINFLTKYDALEPLLVDVRPEKMGNLIGGNKRFEAYQKIGRTDAWIELRMPRSDAEAFEMGTLHNMEFGYYMADRLELLLRKYEGEIDFTKLGVNLEPPPTFAQLMKQLSGEDVVEDTPPTVDTENEPVSKLGEIYTLGNHVLMCGDATNREDVTLLMKDNRADITFHSPPYNVGKTPNGDCQKYTNDSDNKQDPEYIEMLEKSTLNSLLFSEYVFVNLQSVAGNKKALIEYQYKLKDRFADYVIWDKGQAEPAMAYNVLNSRFEFVYIFSDRATRTIGAVQFRGNIDNIVSINSRQDKGFSTIHKATFPVAFATFFIRNFSEQTVLDLFGGTGTTLIACEQLQRKCFMMELDPRYCDVIRKRYAAFINKYSEWQEITPAVLTV